MKELFSWPVAVPAVISLVALGVGVLAFPTRPPYGLAQGCFLMAGAYSLVKVIMWGMTTLHSWSFRLPAVFLAFGAIGVLLIEGLLFVERRKHQETTETTATINSPSTSSTAQRNPALMVRYQVDTLPISIGPGNTLSVLRLHPKLEQWFYTQHNGSSKKQSWPTEKELKDRVPEFITRCEVTNHGEVAALNILMKYELTFNEAKTITKNGGTESKPGIQLSRHEYRVVIPAITPKDTFTFYIVNQCPLFVDVEYPKSAEVLVAGESERRNVSLLQSETNVWEQLPGWPASPSFFPWTGLPDLK